MPERLPKTRKQQSYSHQSTAQRHQNSRPEAIEGKSDERRSEGVNQKIHRCDAGAVAVRPGKVLQQGNVVDAEGAVDATHHHHVDQIEREDNVAVEELSGHDTKWNVRVREDWVLLRHPITPKLNLGARSPSLILGLLNVNIHQVILCKPILKSLLG